MSIVPSEILEANCVRIGVTTKLNHCDAEESRRMQEIEIVRNTEVSMCLDLVMADVIYFFATGGFQKFNLYATYRTTVASLMELLSSS